MLCGRTLKRTGGSCGNCAEDPRVMVQGPASEWNSLTPRLWLDRAAARGGKGGDQAYEQRGCLRMGPGEFFAALGCRGVRMYSS